MSPAFHADPGNGGSQDDGRARHLPGVQRLSHRRAAQDDGHDRAQQSHERRGLVARSANPDDGRDNLVALTSAGRDLVEETLPDHLATEHAITGVLS